jgi:hypothetical protein
VQYDVHVDGRMFRPFPMRAMMLAVDDARVVAVGPGNVLSTWEHGRWHIDHLPMREAATALFHAHDGTLYAMGSASTAMLRPNDDTWQRVQTNEAICAELSDANRRRRPKLAIDFVRRAGTQESALGGWLLRAPTLQNFHSLGGTTTWTGVVETPQGPMTRVANIARTLEVSDLWPGREASYIGESTIWSATHLMTHDGVDLGMRRTAVDGFDAHVRAWGPGFAVGEGGAVFSEQEDRTWQRLETPTEATLTVIEWSYDPALTFFGGAGGALLILRESGVFEVLPRFVEADVIALHWYDHQLRVLFPRDIVSLQFDASGQLLSARIAHFTETAFALNLDQPVSAFGASAVTIEDAALSFVDVDLAAPQNTPTESSPTPGYLLSATRGRENPCEASVDSAEVFQRDGAATSR